VCPACIHVVMFLCLLFRAERVGAGLDGRRSDLGTADDHSFSRQLDRSGGFGRWEHLGGSRQRGLHLHQQEWCLGAGDVGWRAAVVVGIGVS